MQCNQPFFNTAYEYGIFNSPKTKTSRTKSNKWTDEKQIATPQITLNRYYISAGRCLIPDPIQRNSTVPYSNVIGEGDVTSVIFPDGSVQLYFVPAVWHNRWFPFQYNVNTSSTPYFQGCINTEPWLVRSIFYPNNHQTPNGSSDPFSPQLFNSKCCVNLPSYPEHYQKFHNDNSTSTTDIYYFYPTLRQNRILKDCAFVQTEIPLNNRCNGRMCRGPCYCRSNSKVAEKETNYSCDCHQRLVSSVSFMSIDDERQPRPLLKNKKTCTSCSRQYKKQTKRHNHICKCTTDTSDKYVTTFVDQASGCMVKDGRETQTVQQKSKRNDIKTIRAAIKNKYRSNCNLSSCEEYDNSGCSGTCECTTASESDC